MYTNTTALNTLFSAYTNTTALNTLLSSYTSTTALNTALSSYTTLAFLTSVLSSYTVTTSMNTLLNAKQDTLAAGANITISGDTISSTGGSGSSLIVQLDGVNQTATTLNFVENSAVLSNGVLNVSRLTHYDKIPLIYSGVSSIKDLELDHFGNLLFGTDIVATHNYLTSVLASYVTTTAVSAYTTTNSMLTLLNAKVDDSQVLTDVPLNAVFSDTLYTHPSYHSISMITGLQTALNSVNTNLNNKQDNIKDYLPYDAYILQPTSTPSFQSGGTGTAWQYNSQGAYAEALFNSTPYNYTYPVPSDMDVGDIVTVSMDVKFPASGSVSNIIIAIQDVAFVAKRIYGSRRDQYLDIYNHYSHVYNPKNRKYYTTKLHTFRCSRPSVDQCNSKFWFSAD